MQTWIPSVSLALVFATWPCAAAAADRPQECAAAPAAATGALSRDVIAAAASWRTLTDLQIATALPVSTLRGREVSAVDVRVTAVDPTGFWITPSDTSRCAILVLPAEGSLIQVAPGDRVDVRGEFRVRRMERTTTAPGSPYVYAYTVRHAPTEPTPR